MANATYDLNGNTTAKGSTSYGWDFENRLISVNNGAVMFDYDPFGRRIRKVSGSRQYL